MSEEEIICDECGNLAIQVFDKFNES